MRECYITKELKLPRALLSCGRFANFRRVMCRYMELVVFILSAVHTTPLLYFIFVLSIFRDDASFSLLNNSIALNWPRQRAAGYMQRTARRTKIRIFAAFLHPISYLNFIRHNSNARESSCRLIYTCIYYASVRRGKGANLAQFCFFIWYGRRDKVYRPENMEIHRRDSFFLFFYIWWNNNEVILMIEV